MEKAEILMNKPVHSGLSIPELSKILVYEFWCDDLKPEFCKKKQSCVIWIETVSLYT